MSLTVDASGNVTGETKVIFNERAQLGCDWTPARITGRVDGSKLLLVIAGDLLPSQGSKRGEATLTLGGASPAATSTATLPSPDGLWRGTYSCNAPIGSGTAAGPFAFDLEIRLVNGTGTWKSASPAAANGSTFAVTVSVNSMTATVARSRADSAGLGSTANIAGQYDGNTIRAAGWEAAANPRECTLVMRRA
jgi:hypothetical protein